MNARVCTLGRARGRPIGDRHQDEPVLLAVDEPVLGTAPSRDGTGIAVSRGRGRAGGRVRQPGDVQPESETYATTPAGPEGALGTRARA
ncbi:hypothetical protein [Streptomyces sp. NBC_01506]|uniref:hypothetical protein n=1 Tax=Streptomyces sp. NBC_01506 TaxID=2903887 RepID=UPI0038632394